MVAMLRFNRTRAAVLGTAAVLLAPAFAPAPAAASVRSCPLRNFGGGAYDIRATNIGCRTALRILAAQPDGRGVARVAGHRYTCTATPTDRFGVGRYACRATGGRRVTWKVGG